MNITTGKLLEGLPFYVHPLFLSLLETNYETYLVGGIPRDILLNRKPLDIDLAVRINLHPIEKLIESIYKIHKKTETPFLTVNYILENNGIINIAHLRKERYLSPAQLPITEATYSIEEDAKRRDFTINSIYIDIHKRRFIDPLNGIQDLKKRLLRITYEGSFRDDPTRIFRGIRYKTRLNLTYTEDTLREIKTGKGYIKLLTKQRIINELKKIAEERKRLKMIEELSRFSILNMNIENQITRTLRRLDRVLPYIKTSWVFLFYPFFKDEMLNFPLTRKEKQAIYLIMDRPVKKSAIKGLKMQYPFIEDYLQVLKDGRKI